MTASQMPGQTLQPIPIATGGAEDDKHSLLQKIVENTYNWAGSGLHADPHDDDYALYSKWCYNTFLAS